MTARPAWMPLAVVAVLAQLGGCIVLPVPAHYVTARENVGDNWQLLVVPGRTSRAELLLTLGQPDYFLEDETEFVYLVLRNRAGAYMIAMGNEYEFGRTEFRELDVVFDRRGIVEKATMNTGLCVAEEQAYTGTCGRLSFLESGLSIAGWCGTYTHAGGQRRPSPNDRADGLECR